MLIILCQQVKEEGAIPDKYELRMYIAPIIAV
jgi:hypothetical protein